MAARKRPVAKKKPAAQRRAATKAVRRAPAKNAVARRKPAAKKAVAKRKPTAQKAAAPRKVAAKRATARKSKYVLKTTPTSVSVGTFLAGIADAAKRADAEEIARMLGEITGVEAKMWGPSIVGFGQYHYRYDSGHEGDMCLAGFSPRKDAMTVYLVPGYQMDTELMGRLGKFRTGKSCLYFKRLSDVDRDVLRELMERSVAITTPLRTA